ncbi:ABC transporter permease subunit [Tissierella pigra]|uniref:ABC transporter permease subunit n=1 Tax=Tissierella pigra TaxID=2607614 RepID=A0A6N7XFP5_9FIRM|nr:ABC transporter permease subunit [Tissierella pigra]MBU5426070.1 ABC transporter permease subunit [Tissierella pigra]MSU00809.1 ABC transporter permease subunit [Tissierella pigra]
MLKSYGIRQVLNKKVFFILIVVIVFVCISELNNLKLEDFNNRSTIGINHSINIIEWIERLERTFSLYEKEGRDGKEVPYFRLAFKSAELAMENLEQGNYMEAYKYEMMVKILELNLYSHLEQREYIEPIARPIWEDISPDIEYPDNNGAEFDFDRPLSIESNVDFKYWLTHLQYLYTCYNLGIPYVEDHSANNMVFLYKIMDKIIPVSIILFILLLTYDTVSEEHRIHISRNILSQPIKRYTYLREKIISNISAIVPTIIITITLICIFATIYTDSHPLKMPILTTNNQWVNFYHNGMNIDKEQNSEMFWGSNLGPVFFNIVDLGTKLFDKVVYIPFWQVLLIFSLEMILFVVFILSITIYTSAMTNKKSISIGVGVGIIGGLYLVYKYFPKIPNPLLALETRKIISGASNFTLLSLTLIQVASILVVVLVGNYLFNRKDISY